MKKLLVGTVVAASLMVGTRAIAQAPVSLALEGRGAFAVPTGEWNEEDGLGSGFGYGLNAQVGLGALGVYAGWERFEFGVDVEDADLEDVDAKAIDQGFRAGLMASVPVPLSGLSPFVQAGVIYNQTSFEFGDDGADVEVESDSGVGFEVGAGVGIPLGPTLSFTPGVRYRTHNAEFDAGTGFDEEEVSVGYFVVDLGLRVGFGR